MSNLMKCSTCNIVINEVLAFICNKIDVMNEECICRICVSAFSESDIKCAKDLLFNSISTTKPKKTRKGQGKNARDIDDIVSLLKITDPEEIPIFVARDLHKLPPVLFDHVDVTRLLKELVNVRGMVDRISEEYATAYQLEALKLEVEALKNASIVNNFNPSTYNHFQHKVNTKRGAGLMDSFNYDSGPVGLSPGLDMDDVSKNSLYTSSPSHHHQNVEGSATHCHHTLEGNRTTHKSAEPASPAPQQPQIISSHRSESTVCKTVTDTNAVTQCISLSSEVPPADRGHTAVPFDNDQVHEKKKSLSEIVQQGEWKPQPIDEKWCLVQRRKLRNRFVGNKGKAIVELNNKFKAAEVKIPIYIYNVSKETSECDIINYIKNKTSLTVTVIKMNMKMTKDYDSYKIYVPKDKLQIFLCDDFWPNGIAYRRFINFTVNREVKDSPLSSEQKHKQTR